MAKPKNRHRVGKYEDVYPSGPHPSSDRSDRFAVDALIREHGYAIFRRTPGRPVLWIKDGRLYSHGRVLELIGNEKVWDAEYREALYWDGMPTSIDLKSSDDV